MSANNQKTVLTVEEWDVAAVKYYPPKPSNGGGKNVRFYSTQLGKALHLNLPKMTQYGIADYVNKDTGVHDGKFKMSCKVSSPELVQKLNAFKEQLIDDAVKNSQAWFGGSKPISREIAEYNLKFALDYPKVSPNDKTPDTSKDPYFKLSVTYYRDSGWDIQVFDQNRVRLFPSDEHDSPIDLVQKGSLVNLFIQCSSIWIVDGKWGPTFKVVQCMVYPQESFSYRDTCMISGPEDVQSFPLSYNSNTNKVHEPISPPPIPAPAPVAIVAPAPVAIVAPAPVAIVAPAPVEIVAPAPVAIVAPEPEIVTEEVVAEEAEATPVIKKTVRKVVVKK
jgi:hypothetical protein